MEKVIDIFRKNWQIIAGVAFGAIAGYLYWYYIGCESGTCPITSSSFNSTIYGMILGGLFFSLFKKKQKK